MKTTKLMILGVLIGSTAFAAAQGKPKRPDREGRPVPPEMLEKYDKDKDGKLSKEEREAMRADREKEYDKNGDGKLDDEERKAMHEDMQKKMLAKYDKDGDGKLSDEEKKAMPRPPKGERGDDKPDGKPPGGAPAPPAPPAPAPPAPPAPPAAPAQ